MKKLVGDIELKNKGKLNKIDERIRVDRVGRHFSFHLAIMENAGKDAASIVVYNDTPTIS
ncbi:hypothetical protein C4D60_Mb09t12150 [Musa balbisiana]|uniref:Uncharacterized protein n=1 Tax=Musa balbisiana TaxID=52838 RepID=A0A4S8IFT2_MUSBA|nr:hypothetical protein C4D60_Mb09t12150 [Musa balbisiana]